MRKRYLKSYPFFIVKPIFLFAIIFLLHSGFFKSHSKTPDDLYFCSTKEVQKLASYQKAARLRSDPKQLERAKIEYLIDRIRHSKHHFIRNGEVYLGTRAAQHVAFKYFKRRSATKTAEDFINNIASYSSMSGEPYMMEGDDGEIYPLRDIFSNELAFLSHTLEADLRPLPLNSKQVPENSAELPPAPASQ